MAAVGYSARALAHLERAFEFLAVGDPRVALKAATAIQSAVSTPAAHPLPGRRAEGETRELVISFGDRLRCPIPLLPHLDVVRVLAIRHQRELNYPE